MNKSTDIKDHPASYAVMMCNDADEQAKVEYFLELSKADECYTEANKKFDNVHLFKLMKCSERQDEQSPPSNL